MSIECYNTECEFHCKDTPHCDQLVCPKIDIENYKIAAKDCYEEINIKILERNKDWEKPQRHNSYKAKCRK